MQKYAGFIALSFFALLALFYLGIGDQTNNQTSNGSISADRQEPAKRQNHTHEQTSNKSKDGNFDFYVLALSWSPAFCATPEGKKNRQQCGRESSYGFVVHGLWPQFKNGYPEFCDSSDGSRVPENVASNILGVMPSMGLIGHQWRKHGTCTGLSQREYFALTKEAYERIKIPDQYQDLTRSTSLSTKDIEQAFINANAGLKADSIAVSCSQQKLQEVRICLSKDLSFTECREVDNRGCRISNAEILPINSN